MNTMTIENKNRKGINPQKFALWLGMGSIIMDDCVVESTSIIAAGAVLTKGTHVPAGSIYAGMPAKKIKDISIELSTGEIDRIAENYVKYSGWFKDDE